MNETLQKIINSTLDVGDLTVTMDIDYLVNISAYLNSLEVQNIKLQIELLDRPTIDERV